MDPAFLANHIREELNRKKRETERIARMTPDEKAEEAKKLRQGRIFLWLYFPPLFLF